jgi:hypothetical protein
MPNYSFVIDSSFRPFSFDEMLRPWSIYSNAYEKVEDTYNEYMKKADTFKYLADETADDPKARAIYEGYANDLRSQAEDLAKNGLSIANRRALTSLKQRYQGEIGLLERADEQLKELRKGRNALAAAGKTMLYSNDNPRLSDFIGEGNDFNRYAIDAADLRTRGNALGKAMSSREYSNDEAGSILQNQYKIWRQTHGIQDIGSFMQSDAVRRAVDSELIASGAADNLSGRNLALARQNIMNGIYEGAIYEETNKPLENGEYIGAKERASLAQSADSTALNAALYGYKKNSAGQWVPDPELQNVKGRNSSSSSKSSSGKSGKGSSTEHKTIGKDRLKFTWEDGNPDEDAAYSVNPKVESVEDSESEHPGTMVPYDKLPQWAKDMVQTRVGRGKVSYYDYYFQPYHDDRGPWNTHATLEVVPKSIVTDDAVSFDIENDSDLDD